MSKRHAFMLIIVVATFSIYMLFDRTMKIELAPSWQQEADALIDKAWSDPMAPGGAVVVYKAGEPIYFKARGVARVGSDQPITRDSVFRLASLTKQYTAAVIMQLVEEGKIDLSAPVTAYIPDFPLQGRTVTVKHLLTHTSGLYSYTSLPGIMGLSTSHSGMDILNMTKAKDFVSEPGDKYAYNNTGYVMLGVIIENVTGQKWSDALRDRLWKPLGLTHTDDGVNEAKIANMISGHLKQADGSYKPEDTFHMSVPHAAGAMVGTVDDVAKWQEALHKGKVLQPDSYKQMTSKTTLNDGSLSDYGFALNSSEFFGKTIYEHSGGIPGFGTYALYIPAERINVVVYTNGVRDGYFPGDVAHMLAGMAMGQDMTPPAKVAFDYEAGKDLLHLYENEKGQGRSIVSVEGKLFMRMENFGGFRIPIYYIGNNSFHDGKLMRFEVRPDADGNPALHISSDGYAKVEVYDRKMVAEEE